MPTPETEGRNIGSQSTPPIMPEQRKRLFTVIAAIGVVAVVIGGLGLYSAITAPFPKLAVVSTNTDQDFTILKGNDTDEDGLSDYDEIFVHRTSVFVKDSDSDGASDSQEIQAATNPNCPTGQTCVLVATNTNSGGGATAIALRDSLRRAGVPSTVLDSTDDAELLKTYQDVLGGTVPDSNVTTNDLRSLNATQVRALLKSSGLDDATLNAVDDTTLLQIYRDAIGTE